MRFCEITSVLLLVPFITGAAASQGWADCTHVFADDNTYLPQLPSTAVRICREGVLGIAYDPVTLNPCFTAYRVTAEEVNHLLPGRDDFYEDPDLIAMHVKQAPIHSHAFNDTWNKGHCAESHLNSWSDVAKNATFTMANIAPQAAMFNQQTWAALEGAVLSWIQSNNLPLFIITGVAYDNPQHPRRSFDNIAVPDYYFKVLCDITNGVSAGFIGNNVDNANQNVMGQFHSVAEVETLFGGKLMPTTTCETGVVDPKHWWAGSVARFRRNSVRGQVSANSTQKKAAP